MPRYPITYRMALPASIDRRTLPVASTPVVCHTWTMATPSKTADSPQAAFAWMSAQVTAKRLKAQAAAKAAEPKVTPLKFTARTN